VAREGGGPGETTPEQIFCLQLLTERMWRAAARNRQRRGCRQGWRQSTITHCDNLPCTWQAGLVSRDGIARSWRFCTVRAAFRYRQYPNSAQLTACASGHQRTGRQRVRSAGVAAVRLTAEKLCPDNDEQAEDVALVISQVFSEPVSDAPLAGAGDAAGGVAGGNRLAVRSAR
jgi:hypothetical protein